MHLALESLSLCLRSVSVQSQVIDKQNVKSVKINGMVISHVYVYKYKQLYICGVLANGLHKDTYSLTDMSRRKRTRQSCMTVIQEEETKYSFLQPRKAQSFDMTCAHSSE